MRSGYIEGSFSIIGKTIQVEGVWGDPVAGQGIDTLHLVENDQLHIQSTVVIGGRVARWRTIYRREEKTE